MPRDVPLFGDEPLTLERQHEIASRVAGRGPVTPPEAEEGPPREPGYAGDLVGAIRGELQLGSDLVVKQLITLVRNGQNVIVTGPPGTGKTTIAINLATAAASGLHDFPRPRGYVLLTATSTMTTFDTIGGYVPRRDGSGLVFQPGIFLRAIAKDKWVIIDEVNRADIDKAFGQFFTILSGQAVELPYEVAPGGAGVAAAGGPGGGPPGPDPSRAQGRLPVSLIRDVDAAESLYEEESGTYRIGNDWRMIATMNSFDKDALFRMSYAFTRRFAIVHLDVPPPPVLRRMVESGIGNPGYRERIAKMLEILMEGGRQIGPALLKDVIAYVERRWTAAAAEAPGLPPAEGIGGPPEDFLLEAIVIYVLPQLDGLPIDTLRRIHTRLRAEMLTAEDARGQIDRYFSEFFRIGG